MANFRSTCNGEIKVVRNRFGGECKGGGDRLDEVHKLRAQAATEEMEAALAGIEAGDQKTDRRPICPVALQTAPKNGALALSDGCFSMTLIYRNGQLASAHCSEAG